ncbi:hypothetical protein [Nakamurella leprariae]|uniref:Uncharacterized protein n=1 Tax=Nakamurella leprariae TaxID=2803911 RepID=A0A938YAZ1_9ACTN|nr:hypothetical protein [Nakamurella leprariae]MBM9467282.1 hypothetical protein [Nakamurella leprariae]
MTETEKQQPEPDPMPVTTQWDSAVLYVLPFFIDGKGPQRWLGLIEHGSWPTARIVDSWEVDRQEEIWERASKLWPRSYPDGDELSAAVITHCAGLSAAHGHEFTGPDQRWKLDRRTP